SRSTAAAMPPCAQQLAQMPPSVFSLRTMTRLGASDSAVKSPAAPAPTMTTSARSATCVFMLHLYRQHPFNRQPRPIGDGRIHRDFVRHGLQARQDVFQGNALHMRAQVAGPHEIHV